VGSGPTRGRPASLELIKELDFDVLVPWAATSGRPAYAPTDRENAARRIDAILGRLRDPSLSS